MGVTSQIVSFFNGKKRELKIGEQGEIFSSIHPYPAFSEKIYSLPFRSYFENSTVSPTNDMAQNGAITPIDFTIKAIEDYDIYVGYISIEIGDSGSPNLNKFGDLAALTNGVSWYWFTNQEGEYELHEGIKTNKEFTIRQGNDSAGFGDGVNAFLADVSGGASEKSYFPRIDITELYKLPYGLRLRKGTEDRVIFRVRDDLSTITTFNIAGHGIRLQSEESL